MVYVLCVAPSWIAFQPFLRFWIATWITARLTILVSTLLEILEKYFIRGNKLVIYLCLVSTLLEILATSWFVRIAQLFWGLVSTLLEILVLPNLSNEVDHERREFQPFLRFWSGLS